MWSLTFTQHTTAPRERIWAWYEDTASAPQWDPLVAEIRTSGPLATGRRGHNKPPRGPALPSEVTEATPATSYTEVVKLPGARTAWTHTLTDTAAGVDITHGVTCTGPLSAIYGGLFRRSFQTRMPTALEGLVQRAEAGPPPTR